MSAKEQVNKRKKESSEMNINTAMIVGRLAGDPILKSYQKKDGSEGHRCFFRVAVTRLSDRGEKDATKRRTNFIPIVTWGDAAKRHAQFLAKGTEVTVIGEVIAESQKNADGTYTDFFSVQANDIQYGQRSLKNAKPEDLQRQVSALSTRLANVAAAPAPAPAVQAEGQNPFGG